MPVSFAQLNFGSFVNANAFNLHQISWMDSVDCDFQLILLQDSRTLAWPLLNTNFLLFKLFLHSFIVFKHISGRLNRVFLEDLPVFHSILVALDGFNVVRLYGMGYL